MTILGLVAHRLLHDASKKPEMGTFDPEKSWNQLADAADEELRESWLESGLYPLRSTAPMYEVLRKRTCTHATKIALTARKQGSSTATYSRSRTGFEVWVESADKAVAGIIDRAERVDGQIVLSDFKSGDILEPTEEITNPQVKAGYAAQLKLYAALYEQTFGIWPASLRVVPLTGPTRDVPFTEAECTGLLAEASQELRALNSRISVGQQRHTEFANPSPIACRFCTFRPACPAYQAVPKTVNQQWPPDAFGKVWDINVLRDGRINLRVSTCTGKHLILRALSPERHPILKTVERGEQVGIFNARMAAEMAELSEGVTTVLYKFSGSFLAQR